MATYTLIAVCVLVYAVQFIGGSTVTNALVYFAPYTLIHPWTIVTSMFSHGSPLHLLFNMYSLYVLGTMLEPALGRARFLSLYFISGLAGLVAVAWLTPGTAVLGASGAIFGLLGALFIIVRRLGGNTMQIVILLVINVVIGFIVPNIAWQAHIGGLVVGAAIAAVFVRTRGVTMLGRQRALVVAITAAVIVIGAARFLL